MRALSALLCILALLSCGAARAAPAGFPDTAGHWAHAEIERGVKLGFLDGYPDGFFRPDSPVSRAEFVKMVSAAFDLRGEGQAVFEDARGKWFEPYLVGACRKRVVDPDELGGFFRPEEPIPRAEAAAYLVRALGRGDSAALRKAGDCPFPDAGEAPAFWRGAVAEAYLLGVLKGYPDGTVKGQAGSSRAEAVAMLLRALDARGRAAEVAPATVEPAAGEVVYVAAGSLLVKDVDSGYEWRVPAGGEFGISWQPGGLARLKGTGNLESFSPGKLPDPAGLARVLAGLPCPKCAWSKALLALLASPWPEEVSAGGLAPGGPQAEEEVDVAWSSGGESLTLKGSAAGPVPGPSEGSLLLGRYLRVRWEARSGEVRGSGDFSATVWYDPATLWASRVTVLVHGAWESSGKRVVASGQYEATVR